jgi:hypothetical protein
VKEFVECDFGVIYKEHLELGKTRTTKILKENYLRYSTENYAQDHCKIDKEDMIYMAGLTGNLSLRSDLAITE